MNVDIEEKKDREKVKKNDQTNVLCWYKEKMILCGQDEERKFKGGRYGVVGMLGEVR
jgi:hypothetical protein